jgi:hypothetical protein
MASCAFLLCIVMLSVAEEHEIRQLVDSVFRRNSSTILMAGKATSGAGKSRLLSRSGARMAANTLQL